MSYGAGDGGLCVYVCGIPRMYGISVFLPCNGLTLYYWAAFV